jgi:flagellar basal body-associated protein FliL
MEFLVFIVVILILGVVLIMLFIGGIITLFMKKPEPTEQVEVTTVNQFSNESSVTK